MSTWWTRGGGRCEWRGYALSCLGWSSPVVSHGQGLGPGTWGLALCQGRRQPRPAAGLQAGASQQSRAPALRARNRQPRAPAPPWRRTRSTASPRPLAGPPAPPAGRRTWRGTPCGGLGPAAEQAAALDAAGCLSKAAAMPAFDPRRASPATCNNRCTRRPCKRARALPHLLQGPSQRMMSLSSSAVFLRHRAQKMCSLSSSPSESNSSRGMALSPWRQPRR